MQQCTFGNGLIDERSYDLQGRLSNQLLKDELDTLIDDRTYSYDKNSNVINIDTNLEDNAYLYDKLDRLTSDTIDTDIPIEFAVRVRSCLLIIETLYSTGIRRMELVALSIYDIDVKRSTVYVREGKGNKDRVIPIGERALAWLEKYKLDVRPELIVEPDNGILFITGYGEAFERDQLTSLVKKYLNKAKLDVVGSCHLFRHACATHMLDNGADIRFIQAMLGHEDLNTTEIYTRVSIEKLKAVHSATHPTTNNKPHHHSDDAKAASLLEVLLLENKDEKDHLH